MKLAFINNLYPPYIVGGNEMLAREVIEALRGRGHTVHVITGRGRDLPDDGFTHGVLDLDLDRKEESFLGGRTPTPRDVWNWHVFNFRSHAAVRRTLKALKPDLVVVWNLYMASMAPLVAARSTGFPVVIHTADKWLVYGLKDVTPLIWPSLRWRRPLVALVRSVVQPILRRAIRPRRIITISEFMRRVYVDAGFSGNIEAIHLGVPLDMFLPERAPRMDGDVVRFLYVGSLWEGKGPQVAVKALSQLVAEGHRRVHLDIYGTGTDHFVEHLKGIIREHRVDEHVTLHGFVQREQLAGVYRDHDVLLFPSVWDEPFAAVPVEAMASGTPVIGTTAGGTPEAVRDGETGFLVPPGDADAMAAAMRTLVSDPELRLRFGRNASSVAHRLWNFQTYVDRLEERYSMMRSNSEPKNTQEAPPDPRDDLIARVANGKSFADVGGLWGLVNEKVSVAHQAGAHTLAMIDRVGDNDPLWPAFEARCRTLGLPEVSHITGDINTLADTSPSAVFDVVHSGGVLYHAPDPIRLLRSLRRITREHLILGTLVTATRIQNEQGTLVVPDSSALFIPALQRHERAIVDAHWRPLVGDGAVGLTRPTEWDPDNYVPWWWLPTVPALRAMCEVAGFRCLDGHHYWHDNAYALLLATK